MKLDLSIPLPMSEASVRAKMQMRDVPDAASVEGQRLKAVMQNFEALLLEQMLKEMQATVPESGLFGRNRGQEIFNELLHGEYAELMERRGGIGLADFILEKMGDK